MRIFKAIWKALLILAIIGGIAFAQRNLITDIKTASELPCEDMLYEAMMDQRDVIFLIGYGLDEQQLYDVWCDVAFTNPDLFFIDDGYQYTMLGSKVLSVTPGYKVRGEALAAAQQIYSDALDEIHRYYDPDWTQLQTALFFHDYLCMYFSYDDSLSRFSAYDLLTEGTGVCQAYALLYDELLSAYGIECDHVISAEMNHAWNVVTIDGVKYNVDVTYDDPTFDKRGRANHDYFLLSDEAISKDHQFTAAEGYGQCTDTRYDSGAVWENVKTGFVPVDGSFYFIKSGMLYRWNGGEPEYIDTIYATWFTGLGNDSYWKGNHSTLWAYEDMVLYSKPKAILSYTPATGEFYYQYQNHEDEDIYGFSFIDGELVLQLGFSPNEPGRLMTVTEGFLDQDFLGETITDS